MRFWDRNHRSVGNMTRGGHINPTLLTLEGVIKTLSDKYAANALCFVFVFGSLGFPIYIKYFGCHMNWRELRRGILLINDFVQTNACVSLLSGDATSTCTVQYIVGVWDFHSFLHRTSHVMRRTATCPHLWIPMLLHLSLSSLQLSVVSTCTSFSCYSLHLIRHGAFAIYVACSPKNTHHVPYRDSKLTRILQPALGGNSRTVVVCAGMFCRDIVWHYQN